ncbi:MAG: histidinol dehydrogenase [Pseudomonadales bacterium]|nr:histidinol dehydrogenase [Pseudomonadales bacterium]
MIKMLDVSCDDFETDLDALLQMPVQRQLDVKQVVEDIIDDVRRRGDLAVLELTNQFDRVSLNDPANLEVRRQAMQQACDKVDPLVLEALADSIARVKDYHQKQKQALGGQVDWSYEDSTGNKLGQIVRGMARVGVYVPGGKASYPSSVIMTVIPAKVAEVEEVILMVPAPDGELSDILLAAAHLCGVDRMFRVGGAQAIAALAYGTESIPRVDKIVGPGNIYVATAKEQVFGQVGIDMIAGPSEVVIVADGTANPEWLVMDMFAQAEHDELAQSILISTDKRLLDEVEARISTQLPTMKRKQIIQRSIVDRGALIYVRNLQEAADIVNRIAPEHLEIALSEPELLLNKVRHAGAIFIGNHSAEVVGDYSAGPSHVLPTNGTARFASPLGVYDFQVRSSLVQCSRKGAVTLNRAAAILAREEGLEAHALAAECRLQG